MSDKEYLTIQEDNGSEKVYEVDAMFEMGNSSYAMVTSGEDTVLMRFENNDGRKSLVNATDEEIENLMNAYSIAIENDTEDEEQHRS